MEELQRLKERKNELKYKVDGNNRKLEQLKKENSVLKEELRALYKRISDLQKSVNSAHHTSMNGWETVMKDYALKDFSESYFDELNAKYPIMKVAYTSTV